MWIPVQCDWRLNERPLWGTPGPQQSGNGCQIWRLPGRALASKLRRSSAGLEKDDPRYPGNDLRYRTLTQEQLPLSECLEDTFARVVPSWNELIAPCVKTGKLALITAHGNSLRALVKYLNGISNEMIADLNIPTGVPLVYELDDDLSHLRHYYLGTSECHDIQVKRVSSVARR